VGGGASRRLAFLPSSSGGIREGKLAVAKNLLDMKLSIDDIAEATGLTRDEVEALHDKTKPN
jgi:predicted transposase YdaD